MSCWSGKCDLYDHIKMEKTYKKYPENEHSPLVSDDLECFTIFKKRTKGVIYKYVKCKLTSMNIDAQIEKVNNPDILCKKRENNRTVYYYYNKKYYDLSKLNDKGYYVIKEIHFNTLLDLVPYFPYVIASIGSTKNSEHIVLAERSEIDEREERALASNLDASYLDRYREDLQRYYITLVNNYYNTKGREVHKRINLSKVDLKRVALGMPIDANFEIRILDSVLHFDSPRIVNADKGIISLKGVFVDKSLKYVNISFVKQSKNKKLILD